MVEQLCAMTLEEDRQKVRDSIEETRNYCDFSNKCWIHICTNNVNVSVMIKRKIYRCAGMVCCFSDGNSLPSCWPVPSCTM